MSPEKWKALKTKLDRVLAKYRATSDSDQRRKLAHHIEELLKDAGKAIAADIRKSR